MVIAAQAIAEVIKGSANGSGAAPTDATGEKIMSKSKGSLQKAIEDLYNKNAAKGTRSCKIVMIKKEAFYSTLSLNDIEVKLENLRQIITKYCAPITEPFKWFSKLALLLHNYLESDLANVINLSVMEQLEIFECNLDAPRI
jgi:DNA polymerase III delta prime subunit